MAHESGGRFYPVRSVEELVETCGKVLRHTKGYGEPAEQEVFRTDESTSRLAFLVIKRLPDRRLCRTGEILLQEPGGKQIDFSQSAGYDEGETRILWHRGEYYDLIVVENPIPGEWSMSLSSGLTPRAVVLIRNSEHHAYPSFQEPPKISLHLEKVEDEKSASLAPVELAWQKKENRRTRWSLS